MGRPIHLLLALGSLPLPTHVSSFTPPLHLPLFSPSPLISPLFSTPENSIPEPLDDEVVLDIADLADLLSDVGGVDSSTPEPTLEDLANLEAALSSDEDDDESTRTLLYSDSTPSPSTTTLGPLPAFLLNQKNQRLLSAITSETLPLSARVGSGSLPADAGFDPLSFSSLDPFKILHRNRLTLLTGEEPVHARPPSLILRDYR